MPKKMISMRRIVLALVLAVAALLAAPIAAPDAAPQAQAAAYYVVRHYPLLYVYVWVSPPGQWVLVDVQYDLSSGL